MPNSHVGTSLKSFSEAAAEAFKTVPLPGTKPVQATIKRMWLEKGGVVGHTQFKVEIEES